MNSAHIYQRQQTPPAGSPSAGAVALLAAPADFTGHLSRSLVPGPIETTHNNSARQFSG